MRAIRLHGPTDLRLDVVPAPSAPQAGQVLLRCKAVGICGSDLHAYQDGRIGTTVIESPLVLGHEFAGVIEAVGPDAMDGLGQPLKSGMRVAVDPAQPCGHCEICEKGHPNLCPHVHFCGVYPDNGALQELLVVPSRTCFPIPSETDFGVGAMLETFGCGLHAVDLANIRVGDSAAIIGAGPIGLCILLAAKLAGAWPIYVVEKLSWRLKLAEQFGAIPIPAGSGDPVKTITDATHGRGVDVAIEAAWADHTVQQCVDLARAGGRLVLVGIPGDDRLVMRHSDARRKGLTIRMARRMKHVYTRAIELHRRGAINLAAIISHRVPLDRAAEAFAMNLRYDNGVNKIIVEL